MIAKILAYSNETGDGIVICDDCKKVKFNVQEWNEPDSIPIVGMKVNIELINNCAKEITIFSDIEKLTLNNNNLEPEDNAINLTIFKNNNTINLPVSTAIRDIS